MVFIGRWRSRRGGGYGPFGPSYGPAPRGFGRGYGYQRGSGSSCGRDLCLIESGCCLADLLGCGPQLTLLAPSLLRRSLHAAGGLRSPVPEQDGHGRLWSFLVAMIGIYQGEISPNRAHRCPYTPSCSNFALDALHRHGTRRGLWLTMRRLVRCRPGTSGGRDPVPPA